MGPDPRTPTHTLRFNRMCLRWPTCTTWGGLAASRKDIFTRVTALRVSRALDAAAPGGAVTSGTKESEGVLQVQVLAML